MAPAADAGMTGDPGDPGESAGAVDAAAAHLGEIMRVAIAERGRAHVALSGGGTGVLLYRALVREKLDWSRVHLYQVDERVARDDSPDRNATALLRELVARVPTRVENVHLMDVMAADLRVAAQAYADALPTLDAVHLGLGTDGHTASWPPDQPAVRTADARVVVTLPFRGHRRMTLTQAGLAEATALVWLVCGRDKREVLRRVLDGDETLPATHAVDERSVFFADDAAAGD